MTPSRRRFLAVSGLGLLAVSVGGVGLALQGTAIREPRGPLRVLDGRSFSILAAVADRICPGGDGLPGAWELAVPESVDAFLASAHPDVGAELASALALVENGLAGLILDGRPSTFTASSPAEQDARLRRMATSRIGLRRTVYKALVGLVAATYWGDPRTFSYTGWRPPAFGASP